MVEALLFEVSERLISEDVCVYVFSFQDQTPKTAIKKSLHRFFSDNVLSGLCNTEASGEINKLFFMEKGHRRTLYYSFSYTDEMAVLVYAKDRNVAVDIVNPERVEALETEFFIIPAKAYRKVKSTGFGIKTLSWALQEAIGKMKRTGLRKKYAVIDILTREGRWFVRFTEDEKNEEYELAVLNFQAFCVVITLK